MLNTERHTLYSTLQREKIAIPLEQSCKGSAVDWGNIWGDVCHCKSWIADCMAASHWWGKETEAREAGRGKDGADCQSPDRSSGVPFWRWFWWHILRSVNQHLQMKCSPEHFKPAAVMGFCGVINHHYHTALQQCCGPNQDCDSAPRKNSTYLHKFTVRVDNSDFGYRKQTRNARAD